MFALILIFLSVNVSALRYISGCQEITIPDTYVLTRNIDLSSGGFVPGTSKCIIISSDNVVLDGNGYMIKGNLGINYATGIYADNVRSVTIRNIKIIDNQYGYGISFTRVTDGVIENNVFSSNKWGVSVTVNSNNVRLDNNRMCGNIQYDLQCDSSTGTSLLNNKFATANYNNCGTLPAPDPNSCNNVQINACTDINSPGTYVLKSNIISDKKSGACVNINSNFVTLDGFSYSIIGNNDLNVDGIYAYGKKNLEIKRIKIIKFRNGIYMSGNEPSGYLTEYSLIENNEFSYNNKGIFVMGNRNSLVRNKALNSYDGIFIDGNENNVTNNEACDNSYHDFWCFDGEGNYGNGNKLTKVSNCRSGWPQQGTDYTLCPTSPPTGIPVTGCMILSNPGTYFLTQDIGTPQNPFIPSFGSSCIVIDVNGVTLDGRGYKITCDSRAGANAVFADRSISNIIVKNLNIQNCAGSGIEFKRVSGLSGSASIEKNTIISSGSGVLLSNTNNVQVKDTTSCGNIKDFACNRDTSGSSGTTGTGNEFSSILKTGCTETWPTATDYILCYQISGCRDIKIPGIYNLMNDITGKSGESCIRILSDNVILNGNGKKIQGVSGSLAGIEAISRKNITINGTIIREFDRGIFFDNTNNATIINNTISFNNDGIYATNAFNISIRRSNVSYNYNYGISLSAVSNSSLLFNILRSSSGGIIFSGQNFWNNISHNNITSMNIGIDISGDNNFVNKNNVSNNLAGIILRIGVKNTLKDNFACENTDKDFQCISGSNTFGNGNKFTNVQPCGGGWPIPNSQYTLCPFPAGICIDAIDNDGDTYIDMADTTNNGEYCPPNLCSAGKQVTYPVAGNVNLSDPEKDTYGIPWNTGVNPNKIPNIAGCCGSSQCYFNPEGYYIMGCVGDGTIFNISSYNFTCSVSGSSAVWCNTTFANNGSGYCECPLGTLYDSVTGKCVTSGGNCNINKQCEYGVETCACEDCSSLQRCVGITPKLGIQTSCSQFTTQEACDNWINLPKEEKEVILSSIQEHSLIENNFCSDKSLTFEVGLNGNQNDPESCGTYTQCSCYWDAPGNRCLEKTVKAETIPGCMGIGFTETNLCLTDVRVADLPGSCTSEEDYDSEIQWESSWAGKDLIPPAEPPPGCAPTKMSKPLPCPVTTKLPFFTFFNLMISILAIGMIYYLIVRKKIKLI